MMNVIQPTISNNYNNGLYGERYIVTIGIRLSAGTTKWNRPSVTFWSVFQIQSHMNIQWKDYVTYSNE